MCQADPVASEARVAPRKAVRPAAGGAKRSSATAPATQPGGSDAAAVPALHLAKPELPVEPDQPPRKQQKTQAQAQTRPPPKPELVPVKLPKEDPSLMEKAPLQAKATLQG